MFVNFSVFPIVPFGGLSAVLQSPRFLGVACKSMNEDNTSAGQLLSLKSQNMLKKKWQDKLDDWVVWFNKDRKALIIDGHSLILHHHMLPELKAFAT